MVDATTVISMDGWYYKDVRYLRGACVEGERGWRVYEGVYCMRSFAPLYVQAVVGILLVLAVVSRFAFDFRV